MTQSFVVRMEHLQLVLARGTEQFRRLCNSILERARVYVVIRDAADGTSGAAGFTFLPSHLRHVRFVSENVRFTPKSGHSRQRSECLLWADTVAKVPNGEVTNLPPRDQTS